MSGGYRFGYSLLGVFSRRPIAQQIVWFMSIIIEAILFKLLPALGQGEKYLSVKQLIDVHPLVYCSFRK